MRPWCLVTPASRGIGFALARHLLKATHAPIVATARTEVDKTRQSILHGLSDIDGRRLHVLRLDVLDEPSISQAAAACADVFPTPNNQLQLAFILPGVLFPEKSPAQIEAENALLTFRTNALGPLLVLKHFGRFLPRKRSRSPSSSPSEGEDSEAAELEGRWKITQGESEHAEDEGVWRGFPAVSTTALMSARVGSIADNRLGGWYSYRASKAAVNQVVKTFDNHLRDTAGGNAVAVGLHPGTVRTGLSKEFWGSVRKEKLFEKEWVAERLVGVVSERGLEGRGRCWDWEGKEVVP